MEDKKYDVAVFDVDGTLLNTTEGVLASVQYTIDKFGLAPVERETLLTFIGPPIQNSFKHVYGFEGEIIQEIATTFRNQYKDVDLLKAVPYEGIYTVFEELKEKGIKTAIATYKRQDYAEKILGHFHFDRYTNILYGADHENKLSKVDIIEKCLVDLCLKDYSRAVMVGDSSHDAIGAEKIGIDFIGVTYGFEFRTDADVQGYKSVGTANCPMDLMKFF